ncbi:urease accessory protein UreF [Planococcus shenhongbingii]|uniref:Urease accessory protein UreF n=1 Tax=Planococcus shenhongbingii TaxID=3058398 RepID=A0ABT8NBK4_9BACL|nr:MULTISPECIES: urease accessory protein UreF [unclassified Planococcus (in: firmicutes)]MDN7245267.1 urease accessory protein UreF [Planococcus sp. N017]WKA58374.1 urease accessory protein UreF [Planococcus sp. N016]
MNKNLLSLFQLCDSGLPTGAFSHSFGLESYIQADVIKDQKTFFDWLKVYVHDQLIYTDGLVCRLVYDALEKQDLQEIWKWDRMLMVQNLPRETREGTQMIGDRLLKIAQSLYDFPVLAQYRERIGNKQAFAHPSIVFTMIAHGLNVSKEDAVLYYLYSASSSLVQNAVRAIPLGQTAGIMITHEFHPELQLAAQKIMELTEDDFGIASPGIELSQMQHERVNIRIFMS